MNLLAIADEYIQAFDNLSEDECSDENWISQVFGPITDRFEQKASNIAFFTLKLTEDLEKMKEEKNHIIKIMERKVEKLEKRIDDTKNYLSHGMNMINKKSIKTPIIDIALRNNAPKTIIEDESKIPQEFKITKEVVSIDKIAIKKKIMETGEVIDGVSLEPSQTLIIKPNI